MTRRRLLGAGAGALAAGAAVALGLRAGTDVPEGVERVVDTYGPAPRQDGEWWVPAGAAARLPTVVLVHGGFWRDGYDRTLQHDVAADLAGRGFLVWNVDYRSSSAPWPATLADAAAAYDLLRTGRRSSLVDPDRVAVVGHSAGGHLALWLASRHRLPSGAPGAAPSAPRPAVVVAQAPVAALALAAEQRLGGGAVQALLGGDPAQVPERYADADPAALLPTGARTTCVHGSADGVVPVAQSERYVAAAVAAGDAAALQVYEGGHFEHLDPRSRAADLARAALREL